MRPVFFCLSLMLILSACTTNYPNDPPLREVETDEDRLFLEPDRKVIERYQHFVIHRLCREDGGSDALERYRSGRA